METKPYNEQEYNKLCAEFLGWKNKGMVNLELWVSTEYQYGIMTNELKFHSDWNWIMEVFKKIQKEGYTYGIVVGASSIWKYEDVTTPIFIQTSEDPLEASVRVLNQFLNWYNEQKQ